MNAKIRAKRAAGRPAALALALSIGSICVLADDGNLTQQLSVQQHKSRFGLMLEQVRERNRRRSVGQQASPAPPVKVAPASIGNATQSMRLTPLTIPEAPPLEMDSESNEQFRARQAHDRDQQRILEHRQRRAALLSEPRAPGAGSYARTRGELVRFNSENQQQRLQRKLRN